MSKSSSHILDVVLKPFMRSMGNGGFGFFWGGKSVRNTEKTGEHDDEQRQNPTKKRSYGSVSHLSAIYQACVFMFSHASS